MGHRPDYSIDVPEGWSKIERFCYPENGSKAYKSNTTSANVHLVNLYDTGAYVVNGEYESGETFDIRYHDYFDAAAHVRGVMLRSE